MKEEISQFMAIKFDLVNDCLLWYMRAPKIMFKFCIIFRLIQFCHLKTHYFQNFGVLGFGTVKISLKAGIKYSFFASSQAHYGF